MPFPSNTSFTSLFASSIPSEGTTLDKGPSGLGKDLRVRSEVLQNSTRHFGIHYAKLRLAESSWLFTYV